MHDGAVTIDESATMHPQWAMHPCGGIAEHSSIVTVPACMDLQEADICESRVKMLYIPRYRTTALQQCAAASRKAHLLISTGFPPLQHHNFGMWQALTQTCCQCATGGASPNNDIVCSLCRHCSQQEKLCQEHDAISTSARHIQCHRCSFNVRSCSISCYLESTRVPAHYGGGKKSWDGRSP